MHFFCTFGFFAGFTLATCDTNVPSDADLCQSEFDTIPPKLRSQFAAHDPFFAQKYTFFQKKCIFLQKYLVMSKFCCTFALAFG